MEDEARRPLWEMLKHVFYTWKDSQAVRVKTKPLTDSLCDFAVIHNYTSLSFMCVGFCCGGRSLTYVIHKRRKEKTT